MPMLNGAPPLATSSSACLLATPAATMLVDEPMSESVPPSMVAKERGMSICVAGIPSELAHEETIGMNIAQTGVLFMKAEIASTGSSRRTIAHM